MAKHSDELIARIKAGCMFFPTKAVARLTGVPHDTVRHIQRGTYRAEVEPDPEVLDVIGKIMRDGGIA